MTFRLADGGAVTFGLMRRTDTIAVKPTAKELVLPGGVREGHRQEEGHQVAHPAATSSRSSSCVPKTGKAEVIGASELLVSGKGR